MTTQLDLQFHGVSEEDVKQLLTELGIDPSPHTVVAPQRTTGDPLVDLVLALKNIDLDSLSLLIGYAVGRDLRLYRLIQGTREAIKSLADANALLKEIREQHVEEPKQDTPER